MSRPDLCPNCGSNEIRNHTGGYCQDCGEPLFQQKIQTMESWLREHRGHRMKSSMGETVTIVGLEWTYGQGGTHKSIVGRKDDGNLKSFTFWEAKTLVRD